MQDELVRRVARLEARLDNLAMPEVGGWRLIPDPIVLAAPAATVTFSSLPQNYRALVLMAQVRTDRAMENEPFYWRANGDSGNNYDAIYLYGRGDNTRTSGSNIGVSRALCGWAECANSRASNFAPCVAWFPGYALTDREKWSATSINAFMGNVSVNTDLHVSIASGRWRNTAAITSLAFTPAAGPNFVAGSRFTLYGVL